MLKLIEGLPPDVLGVEASGKVTHADYQKVLAPAAEKKLAHGRSSMLYVAGPEFSGYDLEAIWDDGALGVRNWDHFDHIAVVTESEGLREAVAMFCPYFPGDIRIFDMAKLGAAKDWLAQKQARGE